jgi:hypothetical protein
MVLNTLESLVLRALRVVVRDVVAGLTTTGSRQAGAQAPTVSPSFARHLSPDYPGADSNPMLRHELAKNREARAAQRAGRSGSSAGVSYSRTATRTGRSAILSGWSQAVGSISRVGSMWCGLTKATPTLAADRMHPGRTQARKHLTTGHVVRKCSRDGLCVKTPVRGTPSASI